MRTAVALALCLAAAPAVAAVHTETVEYTVGDTALKGFLAYDDAAAAGKRPGVLVVHEWWGLNDYARDRAKRYAEAGYVAFALDMYGGGKTTSHPEEAGQWSGAMREHQDVAKARFEAALGLLRANKRVDASKVAAVGSCFGGAVVLSMAEGGADLAGVVSYHGALPTEPVAAGTAVKAKILAFHGSADPFVTAEQVATFKKNLDDAGADWEFVTFGGAKHSFTNPAADQSGVPGLVYDAEADRRSWQSTLDFLAEIFR